MIERDWRYTLLHSRRAILAVAAICVAVLSPATARAQWAGTYEQFYLPAEHNWEFRHRYPAADRLFNAFDYGHAILYETLYRRPAAPASRLEQKEYDFITKQLLVNPPRVPLEEAAIEVTYAKLVPEAKAMFEWAHLLHRQIYDVWADESLGPAQKDAAVQELIRYYKSRPDVAFSSMPKSMELMDGEYYSTEFRKEYPKFNGLIWAYHWLQIGLYEPLLVGRDVDQRQAGVSAAVTRFKQMLEDPPRHMPYLMPMAAAVAPRFAERYPEAAIIFDNLHMMHDIVSDILTSPKVPRQKKRAEILRMAALMRDGTSYTMTEQQWRDMAVSMGINNMGGPVMGFLAAFPTPTVERGASMAGMDHAAMGHQPSDSMAGMLQGRAGARDTARAGAHAGMPGMAARDTARAAAAGMPGMQHGQQDSANRTQGMMSLTMEQMMAIHERMMADPVIRERVATDPVLQRMMQGMSHAPAAGQPAGGPALSDAERRQAIEFVIRLLNDPQVEARIHADPQLHRLWSDPGVQECLAALRKLKAAGQPLPALCPAAPSPPHKH